MSQYHEVFINVMRKSFEKVFFAKLLGIKTFGIFTISTSEVHGSLSLSGTSQVQIHFQTFLFENIDTILATWPFNRPYPRTRLFRIVLTLQRCTHPQDLENLP